MKYNAQIFALTTFKCGGKNMSLIYIKGTVSPDYKCLEVISIESPLLGHITPDI
jgi:hypothetical protein